MQNANIQIQCRSTISLQVQSVLTVLGAHRESLLWNSSLPRICRTLVPEIRVRPKILHNAHMHDLQLHYTEQQKRLELLMSAVKIIDEDR